MKRRVLLGLGLAVFILGSIFVKVYVSSMQEYRRAEEAYQAGDLDTALERYEHAVQWYTPHSPWVRQSVESLWRMGSDAEETGNVDRALAAYRALRGSLYAVRSFYTPYREWISRCDEKIATLSAGKIAQTQAGKERPFEDIRAESLRLLKKDHAPSVGWAILAEVGFFGWVGSAIGLIFRAYRDAGRLKGRAALRWGLAIIVFYALWTLGLSRA